MVVYMALLLPVIFFRDLTPTNEMKYISIAEEAINSGHTWCMYYNGEIYADKPPVYFWIVEAMISVFKDNAPTVLAFFSLIPAFIILLVFNKWCNAKLKGRYLRAAEVTLMSTAWFLGSAVVLRMDMLMTMFITLAMYTIWKIYQDKYTSTDETLLGIWVFLAIFTKGPVGFLMPLVCSIAFLAVVRKMNLFTKIWSPVTWCIIVGGCALWWLLTFSEGGWAYLHEMLIHQTFGRAVNSFSHGRPFYYYLYTIWYAMGPWSLATIGIIVWALIKKVELGDLTKYFLVISASFIAMMSLFSCKLQIYLLPCFGFINYAAFMILYKMAGTNHKQHAVSRNLRKLMSVGSWIILIAVFLIAVMAPEWMNGKIGGF